MAKEDIEKPKGKKGGMVLIIGIPKPKKDEVKKAARYGRQGGEGGERNRDIKDFQRLMNGDALRRHLTGKRKMTDEQADAVEQEYARAMGAEDFEEAQRMFRENPEKRVPPPGFKPREVNDKYAEMAFSERRERVGKEKRFKGMLNPKLFEPEGLMGRDGITREDMLAYQKTGLYDPNDPDAMKNARSWILNNRDVKRPKREVSERSRSRGRRGQKRRKYGDYDPGYDPELEAPDEAFPSEYARSSIEADDDDFAPEEGEVRYRTLHHDDKEAGKAEGAERSADELRREAEMMGRLLTARGASDRAIEDAMQAIMEGRRPTAQEIGEDERQSPMMGGARVGGGRGLEPARIGDGNIPISDLHMMANKVKSGGGLSNKERRSLRDLFNDLELGYELYEDDFKERFGLDFQLDEDAGEEDYDRAVNRLFNSPKGHHNKGLAKLINFMIEVGEDYYRQPIPFRDQFPRQPGAGRPMRDMTMQGEEPRGTKPGEDFGEENFNPRQQAETTLQNIRYAGGAEVDPDPLPGQRTGGGARVTSRGGGQTTMARPRRNVEQEFDQPIDAAMQRFLSPQEEDAELRARGQDIFTSFDNPRDVMSTAFSLLKNKDENVEDAFMDQCSRCGAMMTPQQSRNHRCR